MSTTARVNGNIQFTFHLVMRLNITIVTSFNSLIGHFCILSFSLLEFENGLKKIVQKVPEIKYISCDFLCFLLFRVFGVCYIIGGDCGLFWISLGLVLSSAGLGHLQLLMR